MRNQPENDQQLESQIVQLTRDLILIESTHSKPDERRRCFQFLCNHLDEIPGIRLRMYENNGFESLVALPHHTESPEILFCAHLDVVEHLGPEYYRSKHEAGRIYGPGAGDMKGALAILMVLFHSLLKRFPHLPIGLVVTSDEEQGGNDGTRFLLDEVGLRAGSVVIPDGGSIDEITVEEKGILHARARIRGVSAHAARPWLGDNPIQQFSRAIHTLNRRFDTFRTDEDLSDRSGLSSDHWYPTCCVTAVDTDNESINRIPEQVIVTFDIRFPPPFSTGDMMAILQESLGEQTDVEALVSAAPTRLEPDEPFLLATESVVGTKPRLCRVAGGSDARFFRQHGIPVMLSRPVVGNIHGHDEWIDIRSMLAYYRICERYVQSKCRRSPNPIR